MRSLNCMLAMCIGAASFTRAMDCPEDNKQFLGLKKGHPVGSRDSQEAQVPAADTDRIPNDVPVDQADLQRKLLDNTDYLLRWTMGQKVTLGIAIAMGAVALAASGYLLYDRLCPVKPTDEEQDQQSIEQSIVGPDPDKKS